MTILLRTLRNPTSSTGRDSSRLIPHILSIQFYINRKMSFSKSSRMSRQERKNLQRVTSPTPSARVISSRRVNHERDTQKRWDHDDEILTPLISRSRNLDSAGSYDSDSHNPFKSSNMNISESVDYESPLQDTYRQYVPTMGQSEVKWKVLLPYYLPIFSWIKEYCWEFALGDLIGGVSLATFQIPLAISYASSLAKVPITCGLFSLGFAPLIYMIFGSVPQMIVGPEAPISLIVGQAVEPLLHHSKKTELNIVEYVVAITFVSGATLLGFGLGRFGFLDNVLCESLLKGFICGVGVVMIINSSITMLGLNLLLEKISADTTTAHIHSPFDKMKFILANYCKYHPLTLHVSVMAFTSVLLVRFLKSRALKSGSPKLKLAVYVPEILILVVASTLATSYFKWNHSGLEIIGRVEEVDSSITFFNPLTASSLSLIKKLSPSGFVCAMLGFFESTTALKSLGSRYDLPISSNRELVALGAINVVGCIFGSLPAFGGYGRSKINALSARTTASGAIMGIISLTTAGSILKYLHYIPKCILSVITAVIGILLISETPAELLFHWRGEGYEELITFVITVTTTIFSSMEAGIAVGLVYLLIRVIKNATISNIQILARVPGTNKFLDADLVETVAPSNSASNEVTSLSQDLGLQVSLQDGRNVEKNPSQLNLFIDGNFRTLNYQALEEVEGCLIIRIPESLTFANASDLQARLKRVEMFGSTKAHPGQKPSRKISMTNYVIFDLLGMTNIDSSAAHILLGLLRRYQQRGIRSFFVHVSETPQLRDRLAATGITNVLVEDLNSLSLEKGTKNVERSEGGSATLLDEDLSFSASSTSFSPQMSPYLNHIRSALQLIDAYELQNVPPQDLLEV